MHRFRGRRDGTAFYRGLMISGGHGNERGGGRFATNKIFMKLSPVMERVNSDHGTIMGELELKMGQWVHVWVEQT